MTDKGKQLWEDTQNLHKFTAHAALVVPYLNEKHKEEFGKMFDPEEFLKEAVSKNRYDLKAYYEESVAGKRTEKLKADFETEKQKLTADLEKQKQDAVEAAKAEAERLKAMGLNGQNPSDLESPSMGAFQKKILKLGQTEDDKSKAPEVALGEGGIAAFAAREFINKQANRTT
jgi:hypothetical protein